MDGLIFLSFNRLIERSGSSSCVLTFSYSVSETVERQLDGMRTLRLPAGSRSLTTDSAPVEPAAYKLQYDTIRYVLIAIDDKRYTIYDYS